MQKWVGRFLRNHLTPARSWPSAAGCMDDIIDGHNRFEICRQRKVAFEVKQIEFADRTAALLWIISNQLNRRNLQAIDRIALINKQETLRENIKARVKEKEYKRKTTCQKSDKSSEPAIDTKKELAKAAGVSHDTYRKGVEAKPSRLKSVVSHS